MPFKHLNVLGAEFDTDHRNFMKAALAKLAELPQFTALKDGEQPIQLLNNETCDFPDVLFLDINIPRKNGFEVLSEIKHNRKRKEHPLVMYSTATSREKKSSLFNSGAHDCIQQPNDIMQLRRLIYHAPDMSTEKLFSKTEVKYIPNECV